MSTLKLSGTETLSRAWQRGQSRSAAACIAL
jgi:hypothetical protein